MDWVFDATCTFDESGDGRSRTYLAKKTYQIQRAAASETAKIEHSSWHFGGSSADLLASALVRNVSKYLTESIGDEDGSARRYALSVSIPEMKEPGWTWAPRRIALAAVNRLGAVEVDRIRRRGE